MIIAFGFLLFLAISPCYSQSNSGSIKICKIGKSDGNDTSWETTIDSISDCLVFGEESHKAPQIFTYQSGDVCEFVGSVDRAKMRADFILVVKKHDDPQLNCDPEWGRQSFAIVNFYPENSDLVDELDEDVRFVAKIAFTSSETSKDPVPEWKNLTSAHRLLAQLTPHFMSSQSRIPDEYPFKAEREERMKRRTLKAVIALMGLAVCSLLVIMFLGSLSRYNESKKLKEQELEKKKKHEEQAEPTQPKSNHGEKSEKSEKKSEKKSGKDKSEKPNVKSSKSAKSEESKSSKSSKKDEPKKGNEEEPLLDKSKKD